MAITADREELRRYYRDEAGIRKPETIKKVKGRKDRAEQATNKDVRQYVFARERDLCRCCNVRPAASMHEITFRSQGKAGQPSRKNSIAVCGQIVGTEECCHTYLQAHQIEVEYDPSFKAEGMLTFYPKTPKAAEWLRIPEGHSISSGPRVETEHL